MWLTNEVSLATASRKNVYCIATEERAKTRGPRNDTGHVKQTPSNGFVGVLVLVGHLRSRDYSLRLHLDRE